VSRAAITAGVLAATAAAAPAHAGGFAVAEQTTTSSGTGGAGAARDDEAGAAWTNPAALADGGGIRAGLGVTLAHASVDAEAMDGSWAATTEGGWKTPPQLQLSGAFGPWAAGVAVGVPFGSGVSWPADWAGRHEIVRTDLQVIRIAPFAAARFGRIRVAAGVHLDVARLQVARRLDFIDVDGDVALDLDGTGLGFDAAIFVDVTPALAVGATYKSRTSVDLAGGADFTAPDAFADKTPDQPATTSITLPDRIAIGARWRRGAWTALADAEVLAWSTYDALVIDFSHAATPDVTQRADWHTTVGARGGAEYAATRTLTARAGLAWDPSPAPTATLAPSTPDSSRFSLTAGATWRLTPRIAIDAFFEQLFLLGAETMSPDSIQARYGGHAQLLGVGVRVER
jgi:long-chain fatty acid transport protein